MGVATPFFRTAGRPVLDHGVDALGAPAVAGSVGGLEAVDIGAGQVGVQARIFTESAVETVPERFRSQVDLRAERRGDAQGAVFFRSDVAEKAHQVGIERGGQAQRRRPQGNLATRTSVEFGRGAGFVAGIGAVVGRDALAQRFDEGLYVVVPACGGFRAFDRGHEYRAQVVF